ncbi:MAG: AhpC/TSA family protein, partial [Actinobacteria bacterium]|nr:AhpC/TSA family protein [Actinomycetota bacterium]
SFSEVMGPRVWGKGLKSIVRHGQGVPKEDPYQLGGVAVIKDGVVTFVHRSSTSADNLPVEELLTEI